MFGVIKKISLGQCVMVFVAVLAIWRPIWLKDFCKEYIVPHFFAKSVAKTAPGEMLFTVEELSKYTGANGSKGLYIAIMGTVYDVEKGRKHYGPGGTYHFFSGLMPFPGQSFQFIQLIPFLLLQVEMPRRLSSQGNLKKSLRTWMMSSNLLPAIYCL